MKVADLQIKQGIQPLRPQRVGQNQKAPAADKLNSVGFGELLQKQISQANGMHFSAHALKRLQSRSVQLTETDLQRLQHGMQQLQAKGAQNSVILMDDHAFVVSVKNKTVVTAIDQTQANERVFTNIDSLAIV